MALMPSGDDLSCQDHLHAVTSRAATHFRKSELHQRATRLFGVLGAFAALCLFVILFSEESETPEPSISSNRLSLVWEGARANSLSEMSLQGKTKNDQRVPKSPGITNSNMATTNALYSECIGPAFGHDCPGPRGHDHGWMRHEQDCVDASKHNWDYAIQNTTSTGVPIGTLTDPRTGLCLATREAPYLGVMWLDTCKTDERSHLWSKTIHQNHVAAFGFGQSDVIEYFNAGDGAALDVNCQGKCFRQRVCTKSKLYKKWVHDSDVAPIPFPSKIPDDPLAPI